MQTVDVRSRQHRRAIFDQVAEALERADGSRGQELSLDCFPDRAPKTLARFKRDALDRFDARLPNPTRRGVDDSLQGNRIRGIQHDLQVRNHVLDLGALVKRETAYHVILQPVAPHRFFKKA